MPLKNAKQKTALVMFGLFLSVIAIEVVLRLSAFAYLTFQDYKNKKSRAGQGNAEYRILCLGESTTALGGEDSYPSQLEAVLNQKRPDMDFKVINEGVPGTDTFNILSQLEYNLYRYKPDMVAVMMGINDSEDSRQYKDGWEMARYLVSELKIYNLLRFIKTSFERDKAVKEIYLNRGRTALARQRYSRAQEMFTLAGEIDPDDYRIYIELGICYKEQGRFGPAEEMYKKAVEIAPLAFDGHLELAAFYRNQGRYSEAQESYKKALELEPSNQMLYIESGWCYSDDGKFQPAEEMFKKAVESFPRESAGYMDLARFYRLQRRYPDAKRILKEALRFARGEDLMWAYIELAVCYKEEGKLKEAEECFRMAVESQPKKDTAYIEFGSYYQERKDYLKAKEMFVKALEIKEDNPEVYQYLGLISEVLGDSQEAWKYFRREKFLRRKHKMTTRRNYRKLKEIVLKKGIELVCVQYPRRQVEGLRLMFDSPGEVSFVDNKVIFDEAVKKTGFRDYFYDDFAGDFGHCTAKGNALLAENVAQTIIEHIDDK